MKHEKIDGKESTMVILDVRLDNFYAFKNFHMNLTYPKKIVGSSIKDEHLAGYPNFRYKKVNIIMGANASGKTTFGHMLRSIFNFIVKKNYEMITDVICNREKNAFFSLDMAFDSNTFYRIMCKITPCSDDRYTADNVKLEIRKVNITSKDSYESCVKRLEAMPYTPESNYMDELEKIEPLDWFFEYPKDTERILGFPDLRKEKRFHRVLENILKALDPSIESVEVSRDVENAYVIRLRDKAVILQDGERFTTELLSSGTKAGVEVACVVSSMLQGNYTFYYCDEKFPYIHSDIEKAVLSLMIDCIRPNSQLFFTTHNTDILDMNLPKHSFSFFRKDVNDAEHPILCVEASAFLKRSTDSLKNAMENDLFSCAPAVDLIYAIADLEE